MPGSLTSNEIEDVVSSVRRLVSTDQRPRAAKPAPDKLLLTPSLRVVPEAEAIKPLILTGADRADLDASAAEAEWVEEPLWGAPEAPLAELALTAEEAELVEDPVIEARMWPEAEDGWFEAPEPVEAAPVVPFPRAAAPVDAAASAAEHEDDDIDVADVLSAAMLEDESIRVMDEAELHSLVRDLVRQELQGSLGERITRNVRKLVRAEVNRALAARALD
ncbi:hypothetical protein [Tabrizicola aquatica]|uniref:hypothetical protein n=1 Tax=Tabrizicola aquatica TaxID=909926 RepID=UPI000CD109B1|nr:hypothetical protein [Tabrizicola aquatica]